MRVGKVASFCNSGTKGWANCSRVFEFDDYSAREYGRANPPRAVLIARFDLEPGTQVSAPPPPFPRAHSSRGPAGPRLTLSVRAGAGAVGLCGGRDARRPGGA